jgi:hypothetical protein
MVGFHSNGALGIRDDFLKKPKPLTTIQMAAIAITTFLTHSKSLVAGLTSTLMSTASPIAMQMIPAVLAGLLT